MKEYEITYRLDIAGAGWNASSPLNEESCHIEMTDEEAIAEAMKQLEGDADIKAWLVSKYWFPKDGEWSEKREVIAQSETKSNRLDY